MRLSAAWHEAVADALREAQAADQACGAQQE
jgi:hypothetical protein